MDVVKPEMSAKVTFVSQPTGAGSAAHNSRAEERASSKAASKPMAAVVRDGAARQVPII